MIFFMTRLGMLHERLSIKLYLSQEHGHYALTEGQNGKHWETNSYLLNFGYLSLNLGVDETESANISTRFP